MSVTTEEPIVGKQKPALSGPISFEEFLEWCDEDTFAEWVDGEVIIMAPASDEHQDLADFLLSVMRSFIRTRQLGWIRSAPFVMRTDVRPSGREPDILFVVQERMGIIQPTHLAGPADLAIEIVLPESVERDRGTKFLEYEAAGVREYWLIDPLREEAIFYQLSDKGQYRSVSPGSDGIYRSLVISGFWVRIAWLWQRPLPYEMHVLKELGIV